MITELLEKAQDLDAIDPLRDIRNQFELDSNTTYLDGNSLGPLPKKTKEILHATIEKQWGNRLIRSWNEDWIDAQQRTAAKIANLINAEPEEIIVCDSVSVNLYKLAFAALKFLNKKQTILTDDLNFPSDLYIFEGLIKNSFPEKILEVLTQTETLKATEKIIDKIDTATALVSLSHVAYKSSYRYDVKAINEKVTQKGALNLWDFSHSVGAVPIDVKAMSIDMAVGCTYKFLNGGPGSPAFLYIKKELSQQLENPIAGWFSHAKPFDFDTNFEKDNSAKGFLVGTPPILSLKGIETGVDIFLNTNTALIWKKSNSLFAYFLELFKAELSALGFSIASPIDHEQRGSHIALTHQEAYRINLSLISPYNSETKVFITDHRPPNIIRIALTPLYQSFGELYELVERLTNIVSSQEFLNHSETKTGVI